MKKKSHLASQAISTLIQLTTNKQPITLLRPKSTTQRPQTTNHQVHDPDALYSSQTTQRAPSPPRGRFKIAVQIQPNLQNPPDFWCTSGCRCARAVHTWGGGAVHPCGSQLSMGQLFAKMCVTTFTFQNLAHKPITKCQPIDVRKSRLSRHSGRVDNCAPTTQQRVTPTHRHKTNITTATC